MKKMMDHERWRDKWKDRMEEIARLEKDGLKRIEIASRLNINKETLRRFMLHADIHTDGRSPHTNEALVDAYHRHRGSYTAMANELGTDQGSLTRTMKRRGLRNLYPAVGRSLKSHKTR